MRTLYGSWVISIFNKSPVPPSTALGITGRSYLYKESLQIVLALFRFRPHINFTQKGPFNEVLADLRRFYREREKEKTTLSPKVTWNASDGPTRTSFRLQGVSTGLQINFGGWQAPMSRSQPSPDGDTLAKFMLLGLTSSRGMGTFLGSWVDHRK